MAKILLYSFISFIIFEVCFESLEKVVLFEIRFFQPIKKEQERTIEQLETENKRLKSDLNKFKDQLDNNRYKTFEWISTFNHNKKN